MIDMQMPNIRTVELTDNYGKFIAEPLERGYGVTLGNSLRRVLLSSLRGTAVTSIKIDNVLHEFSTIPGIVEDTTEMILNIKELLLKSYVEESQKARLEVKDEGEVVAADIMFPSSVELLNPELHIATLTDGAEFGMELTIEKGRGYVQAESNKKPDQPLGTIPIDAIFSPVKKVNFTIENTRVGQITNYDKLILEVWTGGSISPSEAVSEAANILQQHLKIFSSIQEREVKEEVVAAEEEEEGLEEEKERQQLLATTIEELDLSIRSYRCLKKNKIGTVGGLIKQTPEDLLKIKNFGKKSLAEVEAKVKELELSLTEKND